MAWQFTFCFRLLKSKLPTPWLVFATSFSGISAQTTLKKFNKNFPLHTFDYQEHLNTALKHGD